MRPLIVLFVLSVLVSAESRFGRPVLEPAGPTRYERAKLDDLAAPSLASARFTVICLLYRDADRDYVEVSVHNRSAGEITLPADFVSLSEGGRVVPRLDNAKEARRIEDEGSRTFEPAPSGRDPQTGKPVYDRALVDRQAQQHLDRQERESVFASMLLSLAQREGVPVQPGATRPLACIFGPRKAPPGDVIVTVRIGDDEFRFEFKE